MFTAEGFKAGRTDLLLSFEDKLHIALQQVEFQGCFKAFYLHHRLSFIIVRTTSPDTAVAYFGFKRLAFP